MPTHVAILSHQQTLDGFIQHLWQKNPSIQSTQFELNAAKAGFSQSQRPLYNPSLEVSGQHVKNTPAEDYYTAGISQTIDWFNKQGAQAKVARYRVAESEARLDYSKLSLGADALTAIADYRFAKATVRLAKRRSALLKQFERDSARKLQVGDIAKDAHDLARLAYVEAISQQADAEIALAKAKERLVAMTQLPTSDWPTLPNHLPMPLQLTKAQQEQRLANLPTIRILNAKLAMANSAIRVAKTEARPDPTVTVSGGEQDNQPLISGSLSLPLYIRNNYQDKVRQISHEAAAVEQARFNEYQKYRAALDSNLSQYQILYSSTNKWQRESGDSLNAGMDILNRLWNAGELSTTDYIIQLKQRIDSQIAGIELKKEAWDSWFELTKNSDYLNTWLNKPYSQGSGENK